MSVGDEEPTAETNVLEQSRSPLCAHNCEISYGSPGLNGGSFPSGTPSSAIARIIATVM
jgi:hypothetical protein